MPSRKTSGPTRPVRIAIPVRGRRRKKRRREVQWTSAAALTFLALILFLTLSPEPPSEASVAGGCFWCGQFAVADAILNLLLFVPIGFLLGLRHTRAPVRMWAGLTALGVIIEAVQIFLPGRFATLSDVMMNSAGAAIGIGLALVWRRGPAWRIWGSGELTIVPGVVAALATLASTALLSPSLPNSEWFGQWTPDLGHFEQYSGEVLDVRIGEITTPGWKLDNSPAVRAQLLDSKPLVVSFVAGLEPIDLAPVFSIHDGMEREVLVLGARDRDLVFRLRRRASDWKFRSPEALFPGAAPANGDTALVRLAVRDRLICIEIPNRECVPLATPGRGWSLLLGAAPGRRAEQGADVVWLVTLFIPIGFWLRRKRISILGLVIGLVGLLGSSLLGGVMTGGDWIVTGLGPMLGLIGGIWAGRALSPVLRGVEWHAR